MRKNAKKLVLVCTMAAFMASLTACGNKEAKNEDGSKVYSATAQGMGGDVTVDVTVADGKITKVDVKAENETPGISDPAIAEMPQKIIDAQSADVDTISGCTITSEAIKTAAKEALTEAGF